MGFGLGWVGGIQKTNRGVERGGKGFWDRWHDVNIRPTGFSLLFLSLEVMCGNLDTVGKIFFWGVGFWVFGERKGGNWCINERGNGGRQDFISFPALTV